MKKILIILLSLLSVSVFAENFTFNKKTYQEEFIDNFENPKSSKVLWNTNCGKFGVPYYKAEEVSDPNSIYTLLGKNISKNDKVVLEISDKNNFVEDGQLHIVTYMKPEKNSKSGTTYYIGSNFIWLPKSNIKKGSFVEIKFKVPKSPGFDLSLFAMDTSVWSGKSGLHPVNNKGYVISELDFVELTSGRGNKFNYIRPRPCVNAVDRNCERWGDWSNAGMVNTAEFTDVQKKVDASTWYDEWHILQAEIDEKGTSFTTYLDGKKIAKVRFPGLGPIYDGGMNLVMLTDCRPKDWDISHDFEHSDPYEFLIDYVKISQIVK